MRLTFPVRRARSILELSSDTHVGVRVTIRIAVPILAATLAVALTTRAYGRHASRIAICVEQASLAIELATVALGGQAARETLGVINTGHANLNTNARAILAMNAAAAGFVAGVAVIEATEAASGA
jgi:hypothetical protein